MNVSVYQQPFRLPAIKNASRPEVWSGHVCMSTGADRTAATCTVAALAAAALLGLSAHAQTREDTEKAEHDHSASDTGPENKVLLGENPSSNMPPPTDHGVIEPVWYSFDLVHRRVQEGGWTHEVNSKVLPSSKDLAGVNMRLTAGSFRE